MEFMNGNINGNEIQLNHYHSWDMMGYETMSNMFSLYIDSMDIISMVHIDDGSVTMNGD